MWALVLLGWGGTIALLLWQMSRVRSLTADVSTLRAHVDTQAATLATWQATWTEHRARLEGAIDALRDANREAMHAVHSVLGRPDVPAHLAGEYAASVLSNSPASAGGRGAAEPAPLPPVTRPPARGPAGGR